MSSSSSGRAGSSSASGTSPPKPSVRPRLERVGTFWRENKRVIAGALVAVAAYYVVTDARFTVPTVYVVAGVFGSVGAATGWLAGSRVVDWLWEPNWRYVLELDARDDDLRMWRMTPEQFGRMQVVEGELKRWDAIYPLYTVRKYDAEWNTAVATWMGSVDDVELLKERERIDEIRRELEQQAQEGLATRLRASSALRSAVNSIVSGILGRLEAATVDDEGQLESAIQEAIDEHDLEAEIRQANEARESQELPEIEVSDDGDSAVDAGDETTAETGAAETATEETDG